MKQPGTAALFSLSQAIPGRTPACASESTCLLTEEKVLYLLHHLAGSGLIESIMAAYIQPQKANIDRAGQRTHLQTIPHPALCVCASPARCGCCDAKRFGFSQDCHAVRCESLWAGRNLPSFSGTQRKTVKSALNCSRGQTEEQRRQTRPVSTQLTGGFSELFAVENDITLPNSQHKDAEKNCSQHHNLNTHAEFRPGLP